MEAVTGQTHDGAHDSKGAKTPTTSISESCATATATNSKVTTPKEEEKRRPSILPSPAPPADSFTTTTEATLSSLSRAETRVAALQANFDKVEALERDLGIYEMLGEDGDREYRERVEEIKRQRGEIFGDKRMGEKKGGD